MNMNIQKLEVDKHVVIAAICDACERGDITWMQRQELVLIAAKDPQEARDLLAAWRR